MGSTLSRSQPPSPAASCATTLYWGPVAPVELEIAASRARANIRRIWPASRLNSATLATCANKPNELISHQQASGSFPPNAAIGVRWLCRSAKESWWRQERQLIEHLISQNRVSAEVCQKSFGVCPWRTEAHSK